MEVAVEGVEEVAKVEEHAEGGEEEEHRENAGSKEEDAEGAKIVGEEDDNEGVENEACTFSDDAEGETETRVSKPTVCGWKARSGMLARPEGSCIVNSGVCWREGRTMSRLACSNRRT